METVFGEHSRVSEVVTIDQIKNWNNGDIITIKAGTGAGKSHFIKNILYAHAKHHHKKILMLIHRINCTDQFQAEVEKDKKTDVIEIKTYQSIEAKYKKNETFDFSPYQYIVCDEFHYFMSDAAFNKTTDMSLETILALSNKIRIFMSATGDYMTRYIANYKKMETINYELKIYFNFIKQLTFFNRDDTLESFIEEVIERNIKTIFFIQSARKAFELYKKYKDYAMYNCGKSDRHYKYVDQEKINTMLQEEKFNDLILITTTCMDAGVNIIDEELQHIVCDVKDTGTLVQCIGRKRIRSKDDGIYLHIKTITNQQLGGMVTQLSKKLEMAQYLRNNNIQDYIEKYPREYDKWTIVYTDIVADESDKATLKINELMYFKCLLDIAEVEAMIKYGDFGYCKYLAVKFGFFDEQNGYDYTLIEEVEKNKVLENYLDGIVGKVMLQAKDRTELIEKVNVRDGNNNRLLKNIDTLNGKLKGIGLNFIIDQFETSRIVNGKKQKYKQAWRVLRLSDY
ncbi:DEAD/DEAH box helicase family protein [Aneurinibacillus sp. Ricciae_BoGa-3]|uniref:DEAD/DEAH box helicase family protein n=1 Tax=Aneurinibacillus sp. Ricciae_BoGa-3 TaxID=3022697 RepID=UPI002341478A|nr:DEAD/DEAH box helicase family protein [Aneurinibacillus sp. Ricciae_BoGa-3]WCK55122.1 DEAD/DEAH box helicase family protein [Aneurinibacillus sp. Ricciae_BoGa-3]